MLQFNSFDQDHQMRAFQCSGTKVSQHIPLQGMLLQDIFRTCCTKNAENASHGYPHVQHHLFWSNDGPIIIIPRESWYIFLTYSKLHLAAQKRCLFLVVSAVKPSKHKKKQATQDAKHFLHGAPKSRYVQSAQVDPFETCWVAVFGREPCWLSHKLGNALFVHVGGGAGS